MSDPTDLHLMPSSEYVDMYRNEDSLWWYRGLRGWTAMWLGRHGGGKGRLLDAGCGTGRNMVHYAQLGYQVEGCDLSVEALDFCRKRGL